MRRRARELVARAARMQWARAWCTSTRQQPCLVSWATSYGRMGMGEGKARQSRVGSKRAAPQRTLPRASARSLARSERKLACHERCAQRRSRAASNCSRTASDGSRASSAGARAASTNLCDGLRWVDAAAMRRAHGLRAHGQRWLCACGPWACVAWDYCVAIRSFWNFNLKFSVYVILINFKINNLNYFLGF